MRLFPLVASLQYYWHLLRTLAFLLRRLADGPENNDFCSTNWIRNLVLSSQGICRSKCVPRMASCLKLGEQSYSNLLEALKPIICCMLAQCSPLVNPYSKVATRILKNEISQHFSIKQR